MLTALGAETRIKERLLELNMTAQSLATLAGASYQKLSWALRGIKDLENPVALRLLEVTERMMQIHAAFAPLVLSWNRPKDIEWLLENLNRVPEEIPGIVAQLFQERQ